MKKNLKPSIVWNEYVPAQWMRIIKLTSVLLLIVCSIEASASDYSKDTLFNLKMENVSLKEIFHEIESQSEFTFLYNDTKIDVRKIVSINVNGETVEKILDKVLMESGIAYKVINKQIVISSENIINYDKKTSQKQRIIKGKVTDSRGDPLPGVSVVVKGTTIGVTSDIDGNYSLEVSSNSKVLQFSFIGMKTREVKIDKAIINVILVEDAIGLNEVVAVGFAIQKKETLSGAVGTTDAEVLKDRPVTNMGSALQGTIANLNVTNGGGNAASVPSFNIRGVTSINGGDPLILVDGIPVDITTFSRMNPEDVSKVSVLKDAASTAIYGARAAFGVLLVTTKKGQGKLKISYKSNYSIGKIGNLPDVVTDPYTVMSWRKTMSAPWYDIYDEEDFAYAKQRSADLSMPDYYVKNDGTWGYAGNTNWYDVMYGSSFTQNQNLSISGSSDLVHYYLSGSYERANGVMKPVDDLFTKYNFRSKMDFHLTDWLVIGNNTSFSDSGEDKPKYLTQNYSLFHYLNRMNSLMPVLNPDGSYPESINVDNAYAQMIDGGDYKSSNRNLSAIFTAKIDIVKDVLKINADASFQFDNISSATSHFPIDYKIGPGEDGWDRTTSDSQASNENIRSSYNVFNVYATFNKKIGIEQKHSVSAITGFNQEEFKIQENRDSKTKLYSNSVPSVKLASGEENVDESIEEWAVRGGFFRINYTFNDKYILEGNGRYDGTSRFAHADRFVFSPSISAAWLISKESFFKNSISSIDLLKIRGSVGTQGNQNVGAYSYLQTMGADKSNAILDGEKVDYVTSPGLVSSALTWERVKSYNVGLDINMLKNRFTFSSDFYINDVEGMLTKGQTLPCVLGTSVPDANAADMRTRGWEITVKWKDRMNLFGKPFKYYVSAMVSDAQGEITKFSNPTGVLSGYDRNGKKRGDYYTGEKLGEIWGYVSDGLFQSEEEINNSANHDEVASYPGTRGIAPGDIRFVDLNKDGKINDGNNTLTDPGDRKIIGNTTPRYRYSFNLGFEWNGIDCSTFFQGVGKRDYFPGTNQYFWGQYNQPWVSLMKTNLDYWTPDNRDGYFPRMKSYVAEGGREVALNNTRYLQDASYLRVKNFTIGYTLPDAWLNKAKISSFRIYFSGENLFEFTKLNKNLDPEGLNAQFTYPYQRTFSFGVNFNFL